MWNHDTDLHRCALPQLEKEHFISAPGHRHCKQSGPASDMNWT